MRGKFETYNLIYIGRYAIRLAGVDFGRLVNRSINLYKILHKTAGIKYRKLIHLPFQ